MEGDKAVIVSSNDGGYHINKLSWVMAYSVIIENVQYIHVFSSIKESMASAILA